MMRRFLNVFVVTLAGFLATRAPLCAETTNAAPSFPQVFKLLQANLPGMSAAKLNAAAIEGLLRQLHGRATLVGAPAEMTVSQNGPELIKSAVLESNVGYLRVGRIGNDLAKQLAAAYHQLTATHKIAGVVLDLRFADGADYPAAVAAADLFVTKNIPLLQWNNKIEQSRPAKTPIPGPLAVLVNGGTRGAAEALAAMLREADAGLIIGNPTAGLAMMTREFPLGNGERLRIAMDPVKLGNGKVISRVSPDIAVAVTLNEERAYLKNPYAILAQRDQVPAMGTNDFLTFVDHTSEADLVRQKLKDGEDIGAHVPARSKSPPRPVVQDPVLARALDLIKGLAIVRESHR